jgi:hypothetical protein
MRIVIQVGDRLNIETEGVSERGAAAAATEAMDGGGAPLALVRRYAESAAIADVAPVAAEQAEAPGGEAPLNPLRAGEQAARGAATEGEGAS